MNFGALMGFLILHLSVINHYIIRQKSTAWVKHLLFPLVGLAIIGFVLYEMDIEAKILGLSWLAIGIVYYFVLRVILKRKPVLELQG